MDKLYFEVIRTDSNTVTLKFNSPHETKLAFRAVVDLLDDPDGIFLIAKPSYAIILKMNKGGWVKWRRDVTPFTVETSAGERYYLTLMDGKIAAPETKFPLAVIASETTRN